LVYFLACSLLGSGKEACLLQLGSLSCIFHIDDVAATTSLLECRQFSDTYGRSI
jgi:hypothetical protein